MRARGHTGGGQRCLKQWRSELRLTCRRTSARLREPLEGVVGQLHHSTARGSRRGSGREGRGQ